MVTAGGPGQIPDGPDAFGAGAASADLVIRVDGSQPLSAAPVTAITAVCDAAENRGNQSRVVVHTSGAPGESAVRGFTVRQVSTWERALRRLERLPSATVAVADGDCGGLALDALLATDYRIAAPSVRLLVSRGYQGTWPGMALYRLAHQAGAAAVRRAVLFGVAIEADRALALHLLDEVTADPARSLASTAELMSGFAGAEVAIRRQLMLDAVTTGFEDALGTHLAACDRVLRQGVAEVAT